MVTVKRCASNPLIVPADVKPSRPDFQVDGVFNCGVCRYQGETILACRVAESVRGGGPDAVRVPVIARRGDKDVIQVMEVGRDQHPDWDFSDSRKISYHAPDGAKRIACLTSLSHIRLARSADGVHFTVEDTPSIFPNAEEEGWGMEDPRVTQIGETYYINYTAVSEHGPSTALISTRDFKTFERHGIIFVLENKDVSIFPQKIGGMYYALNRPFSTSFGTPDIWIAQSPDLFHWGRQRHLCAGRGGWENGRIGGGGPPILTGKGWLAIYHAADAGNRYCLGAMLLDRDDPCRILARAEEPILQPETPEERNGFFGGVVFTCGSLLEGNYVIIYYGAADDKICRADIPLEDIYRALNV